MQVQFGGALITIYKLNTEKYNINMKLGNIFKGNVFIITQTNHSFDSAIDAVGHTHDIYAPCDLKLGKQLHDGRTPYFEAWNSRFMLRFVHCRVTKSGLVRKGEIIGTWKVPNDPFADHVHIALQINGRWANFMEYLDRRIKLEPGHGVNRRFAKWSSWADKQLQIGSLFNNSKKSMNKKTYTVKPGEYLALIAKKLNVTVNDLVRWNGIRNKNLIYANQKLVYYVPKVKEKVENNNDYTDLQKKLEETKKRLVKNEKELSEKNNEIKSLEKQMKALVEAEQEKYEKELQKEIEKRESEKKELQEELESAELVAENYLQIKKEIKEKTNEMVVDLSKEVVQKSGIIEWYGKKVDSFVDKYFKGSKKIKSILKYGIFVIAGSFIGMGGLIEFADRLNISDDSWIYGLVVTGSGVLFQVLLANYDKNKDGKLNSQDY